MARGSSSRGRSPAPAGAASSGSARGGRARKGGQDVPVVSPGVAGLPSPLWLRAVVGALFAPAHVKLALILGLLAAAAAAGSAVWHNVGGWAEAFEDAVPSRRARWALSLLAAWVAVKLVMFELRRAGFMIDPVKDTSHIVPAEQLPPPPEGTPKVCVVGAGFSGLGVMASLTRHHIDFECFEGDSEVGGNWRHGTYETVHIISSRLTTEYKDFRMPDDYPDFPSRHEMNAYLASYADHWGLRDHIRFNTKVVRVQPAARRPARAGEVPEAVPDADIDEREGAYGSNGWIVTTEAVPKGSFGRAHDRDAGTGRQQRHWFGAIVVSNGHHWDCRYAGPYEGEGSFTGEVMHSKDYKQPETLAGKRVLVIGGGNSACDIAVEAGRFADESHVSHRRGYWILPRLMLGKPLIELVQPWMPIWLQRIIIKVALLLLVGDYRRYGLQVPDHKLWERHPTINSELLENIKKGIVAPHPDIAAYEGGKRVRFVDGEVREFDLIVHCTGYHVSLPLLEGLVYWHKRPQVKGDGEASRSVPDLVQGLISPRHTHLYVFGLGQPRYGAGPLITSGADSLAKLIAAQSAVPEYPLGRLLSSLGKGVLKSYLLDPHAIMRDTRHLSMLAPMLPGLARRAMAKEGAGKA